MKTWKGTKLSKTRKSSLRSCRKQLRQIHGKLQRMRLAIEPESPHRFWSYEVMGFVLDKPRNPTADSLLDAEFNCLEAAEEITELLTEQNKH